MPTITEPTALEAQSEEPKRPGLLARLSARIQAWAAPRATTAPATNFPEEIPVDFSSSVVPDLPKVIPEDALPAAPSLGRKTGLFARLAARFNSNAQIRAEIKAEAQERTGNVRFSSAADNIDFSKNVFHNPELFNNFTESVIPKANANDLILYAKRSFGIEPPFDGSTPDSFLQARKFKQLCRSNYIFGKIVDELGRRKIVVDHALTSLPGTTTPFAYRANQAARSKKPATPHKAKTDFHGTPQTI